MVTGRVLGRHPTAIPGAEVIRFEGKRFLYARIRVESPHTKAKYKYIKRSLETEDLGIALQKIGVVYASVVQDPEEFSRTTITRLAKLVDEYSSFQQKRVIRQEITAGTLKMMDRALYQGFLPFCMVKRYERVMDVSANSFQDYGSWRMDTFSLSAETVNIEIRYFKGFLIWCQKYKEFFGGYFWLIPLVRQKKGGPKPNSAFKKELSEQLTKLIIAKTEDDTISAHQRWMWKLFSMYFFLMLDSGMRTDEVRHLQWKHIQCRKFDPDDPNTFVKAEVDMHVPISKTGPRDAVIQTPVFLLLLKMYEGKGFTPTPEDYCFLNIFNRQQLSTQPFTAKFKELHRFLELGKEYTLYSCRSTYITERIIAGVPLSMIAKNVGNSERVIADRYEDVILKRNADVMLQRKNAAYLKGKRDPNEFSPLV